MEQAASWFTEEHFRWLLVVPILPLGAYALQIFFGRFLPRKGDWLPTGAMFVALGIAAWMFWKAFFGHPDPGFSHDSALAPYKVGFPWLTGSAPADSSFLGILYDNLSAAMLFVVTLVSFLVHFFSIGYMHGDRHYNVYFANISLFTFAMLTLVLADNFLMFFIAWEIMGLCSYLLIGHFFEKPSAAAACKKAFLTTRVGDVCLFLGIAVLYWKARVGPEGSPMSEGTFNLRELFERIQILTACVTIWHDWLTLAGLLVFGGAVGKSAQFPLHVWLPDAMEGPTPVSAMIHAATMVAAGVYLVGRSFVFLSPDARVVIALTGSFTAIFAATIGICATDIKKVLAYSTVSQLGYMIAGLGVGGYAVALFHMVTHAFFKACLFLGSGSVIHAVHSNEMPEMGGLRKKMPITYYAMLASTLAIAGVPLFAGFYSKDGILASAFERAQLEGGLYLLPAIFLVVAAGVTAFYMFRLIHLTFHGEPRDHHRHEHAHESPFTMTLPLVVLGGLAVVGGQLWILHPSEVLHSETWFTKIAEAPFPQGWRLETIPQETKDHAHHLALALSLIAAAAGIALSYAFYYFRWFSAEKAAERLGDLYRAVRNKYYVDEFFEKTVVAATYALSSAQRAFDVYVVDGIVNGVGALGRGIATVHGWFDRVFVDGLVNLTADLTQLFGAFVRLFQSGRLQQYASFAVAGAVGVAAWFLLVQ